MNDWMAAKPQTHQPRAHAPFPWLTIELTLWGILLLSAAGLRLLRLDAAPLNTTEARDALTAWKFAQGYGAPDATGFSPTLFSAQWFTFLIFGANELTARILPALAGTLMVVTPVLMRRQLGRGAALATGLIIALSPTGVTLSRTASGESLVSLGALLFCAGLWQFLTQREINASSESQTPDQKPTAAYLAPFGIALMLTASPLAYSALITVGAALLLTALIDRLFRSRLQTSWKWLSANGTLGSHALAVLVGSVVLFSTAFAWHLGGLAAMADLLPGWLAGFVRWPDSLRFSFPVFILFFYEPLALFLGGIGIVIATLRGNAMALFLALWGIIALLFALIRPGHGLGDIMLVIVPLALLGGLTVAHVFDGMRRRTDRITEAVFVLTSVPLWAYLFLNLATYVSKPAQYTYLNLLVLQVSLPTFLTIVFATVLLLLILSAGIALILGQGPALRGLVLSIALALFFSSVATTWGVSQNRPADPRELLVLEPTAVEIRLLKESLSRVSIDNVGGSHAVDVTLLLDDPALSWAMRDFDRARVTELTDTPIATTAVIAPQALGTPPLGDAYIGQRFPLRRRWGAENLACQWNLVQLEFDQVRQLDCSALANWFMYRRSPYAPTEENVMLWIRQES